MAKDKNKPKIVIALPCSETGSMKSKTAHAIGCMVMNHPNLFVDFLLKVSCDIVSSRTWLVNEAIKKGGTHILFVDYDMDFPEDTIDKLLAHGKEIVGVEYNKRKLPLEGVYTPLVERSETELYRAGYVGTGLLLIDLAIFQSTFRPLKGPWFNFGRDSQGALALGEDVWFCNTARDAGYDVWIDPTIKVKHLGEYAY